MESRAHAEATEWFVRLHDARVSAATHAEFANWLLLSPDHVQAYLDVTRTLSALGESAGKLDTEELMRQAAADRPTSNVVPLERATLPKDDQDTAKNSRSRWILFGGAAALGVLAVIALWFVHPHLRDAVTYRTEIGEQRSLSMADETFVMINTDSVLVMYRSNPRLMKLESGEAQFNVPRSSTPFVVKALRSSIITRRAKFNLRVSEDRLAVGVLNGSVEVKTGEAPSTHLQTGQRFTVTGEGAFAANVGPPLSYARQWPLHRLAFHDQPLSVVIAEINRYHRTKLRIQDERIASQRITGTFDIHDLESFVQFVTQSRIARVVRQNDESLLLVPPDELKD